MTASAGLLASTPGRRTSPSAGKRTRVAARNYLFLLLLAAFFLLPFLWLVLAALKTPAEWASLPIRILPEAPQWENFVSAFTSMDFLGYAGNSFFLAVMSATLTTISSAAVGFGFARLKAPGKDALFLIILATMMIPGILTLIPTYVMFSRAGLVDTYWPWVLWGLAGSPYMIFFFRQFFSSVPRELEDAAIVDGAGWVRIFVAIFLPLSRTVLTTCFILTFTFVWGDYVAPAIFLGLDKTTLAVAITAYYQDPVGNIIPTVQAAGAVMYTLPVLVLFFFAQKSFVRGALGSGVKG